jgi:hypothetical protein
MSILSQLDRLLNIEKMSLIDMKLYIYLHKHCKRNNFIPAFKFVAKDLRCSVGALNKSYQRLIEHNIIKETRKKKIGHSYCYEFEFI